MRTPTRVLLALSVLVAPAAQGSQVPPPPVLAAPRVRRPPALADFVAMRPPADLEPSLLRIEGFLQRLPEDGAPSTQRTEAYLGYDDAHLYAVFVCFDQEPRLVRAHLARRENILGDDAVGLVLDTFHDRRRAYAFSANPLGVQADSLYVEGQGADLSFDTVWHSDGRRTDAGYVVWMAIPFESLRAPRRAGGAWGLQLNRDIPRLNEETYWPHYSRRIEGRLNQAATLAGLAPAGRGHAAQLIPYVAGRDLEASAAEPGAALLERRGSEVEAGLDARFALGRALVLDATLNPDFSQVETDEPLVTVNQRFELARAEKRHFFLENAHFFRTPVSLLYTRSLVEPRAGLRLSGKAGAYGLGLLLVDDEDPPDPLDPPAGAANGLGDGPGDLAGASQDRLDGATARLGVARLSRDVGRQSSLGMMFTHRALSGAVNRVAALDGRFALGSRWTASLQAASSRAELLEGGEERGSAWFLEARGTGLRHTATLRLEEREPGFRADAGFIERAGIRRAFGSLESRLGGGAGALLAWVPLVEAEAVFDPEGAQLDRRMAGGILWEFRRQSFLDLFLERLRERLRPAEFPGLEQEREFAPRGVGLRFGSSPTPRLSFEALVRTGTRVHHAPPAGQGPALAEALEAEASLRLWPLERLRVDATWLLTRLQTRRTARTIFEDTIFRSTWSWQFTRALGLRWILDYHRLQAGDGLTALEGGRQWSTDLLLSYAPVPGTALYAGHNVHRADGALDPALAGAPPSSGPGASSGGRRSFAKAAYLWRF